MAVVARHTPQLRFVRDSTEIQDHGDLSDDSREAAPCMNKGIAHQGLWIMMDDHGPCPLLDQP